MWSTEKSQDWQCPPPCFLPSSVCSSSSNVTPASVVLLSTSFSTLPPPPLLSPLPPFTQLMPRYTGMSAPLPDFFYPTLSFIFLQSTTLLPPPYQENIQIQTNFFGALLFISSLLRSTIIWNEVKNVTGSFCWIQTQREATLHFSHICDISKEAAVIKSSHRTFSSYFSASSALLPGLFASLLPVYPRTCPCMSVVSLAH